MSMKTLEREILNELRKVTGNQKLKMSDIMEWSSAEIKPQEGETLVKLPVIGVWASYKSKP